MGIDVQLNDLFTSLYTDIRDVEEKSIIKGEFSDITYNDMHVIDAIGVGDAKASSLVAKKLHVTMGTLTKAIDGLVSKGYVKRERSESDKRKVMLSLLDKGSRAYEAHEQFHKKMVAAVLGQMDEHDASVLSKMLGGLQGYFREMAN